MDCHSGWTKHRGHLEFAGRLARPDTRIAAGTQEDDAACGPLSPDEREDMVHGLDAHIARRYGQTERCLVQFFETCHEGWDNGARLIATLRRFQRWTSASSR
jgi:hypothetical protein